MCPFSLTPKTSPSEHLHYKPEHEGDHPLHTLRTLGARESAIFRRGNRRGSSVEFGEHYLTVVSDATVRLLDDIERTFAAMPGR